MPEPESSSGWWQGAKPWHLAATFLIGAVLYVALPRLAPVPDASIFTGTAARAVTKDQARKPVPAAASSDPRAQMEASIRAQIEAEAKAKADADAKVKAVAAEQTRQKDWVRGLHMFAIFLATIVGIIIRPVPMGAVALIGAAVCAFTGTLTISQSLSGYSETALWLIVVAFMFARGFIKSGLGTRIAYFFIRLLGKRTLGLAYGMAATEFVLGPLVPSNTARTAGVMMPITRSLARAYGSNPDDGTARKIGAYLTMATFYIDLSISAMFLTAMAANPMAQKFAADFGIKITWGSWFVAGIVPGITSLLLVPYILYLIYPPEITHTPEAVEMARAKLREMGKVTTSEWLMVGVFAIVLVMWVFGDAYWGIDGTTAALVGLGLLLVTGVLKWSDVLSETNAWDVLFWTGTLIMMAGFLNKMGMIPWFSKVMAASMAGHSWKVAFLVLGLTYFYAHYFFASMTAHVGAMYAAFLGVSLACGAPPMLAALVLCFFSNLHASMTHYGTGPAAAMFGQGFVPIVTWWRLGFIISIVHIAIWVGVGGAWWKVLGLW